MKNLLLAFALTFTCFAQAQAWSSKMENAQFQIRVNGHTAYSSEVRMVPGQGPFTKEDFKLISDRCRTKEGVFNMELSQDKSTITIYFLEWIDQWTINWLFSEANPALSHKLRVDQKVPFSF